MNIIRLLLVVSCFFAAYHCAGVDSGIKMSQKTSQDIQDLERRKRKMLFMYIGPDPGCEGRCVDRVQTEVGEEWDLELKQGVSAEEQSKDLVKRIKNVLTNPPKDNNHSTMKFVSFWVNFTLKNGEPSDGLIYFIWNPANAKMKEKMTYSSTKVLNKFTSSPRKHQASDGDDLSWANILGVVCKTKCNIPQDWSSTHLESYVGAAEEDGQNVFWGYVELLAFVGLAFGSGYMLAKYQQKESIFKQADYEALNVEMA